MNQYLIAGTIEPQLGTLPLPTLLAQSFVAYFAQFRSSTPLQVLELSPLVEVNLGNLWKTYSQLIQSNQPIALVYPGSLGDGISAHQSVADLAKDWRIPIILTLPVDSNHMNQASSQAVAFSALANQAGAKLSGIVLCLSDQSKYIELIALTAQIQSLARVAVLGNLDISAKSDNLAQQAATLDWELLNW